MSSPVRPLCFALPLLALSTLVQAQETALRGTFTSGPIALTFEADSHRISRGGQVGIIGNYHVSGDTITFLDVAGPIACNASIAGRYVWRLTGLSLTFTLVDDACGGRRGAMTGSTWTRQAGALALTGLTLIDATSERSRPATTILISEGRIADVFPDGSKPLPEGSEVRDLRNRFVIPGLIDAHVHLATNPSAEDSRARVEPRLRRALLGGVTSVRDMAGDARALADLARAAKVGDIVSPFIYYSALFAGPDFFTDPRVQASSKGEKIGEASWARAVHANTDWRQVVAEARGAGASGIKLYADVSPALLGPLVAEAHRQGLRVWAHAAPMPARPRDMVAAGVDVLSHAPLLAREADSVSASYRQRYRAAYGSIPATSPSMVTLIGQMLANKTMVEPTLFVFFQGDSITPPARWAAMITGELARRHVPIVAGTDGIIGVEGVDSLPFGALPHIHDELELLVKQAGLSHRDALEAATINAARAIGIDSITGTIAPGKRADLVVLAADPLVDITNTRRIELVVQAGKVYRWSEE